MSDAANRARFSARFGARFISVLLLVVTETERKRAQNRARFATSDNSLIDKNFFGSSSLTKIDFFSLFYRQGFSLTLIT